MRYTGKGNPKVITQGNKVVKYQYDKLSRLIGVNDSENGQSSYQYRQGEADIRVQLDDRTGRVTSHQHQITNHNQNASELFYARMEGSPWQAVVWDQSLAKLLVPSPAHLNSPNGGHQSSQQRRRLYDAASITQLTQHRFDKASNSFFIPPEYQSINCIIDDDDRCNGKVSYVRLYAPASNTVGQTVRFIANAGRSGYCTVEYTFAFQGLYTTNTSGIFDVPLTSAGTSNAVVTAACCGYVKWFSLAYEVKAVEPPPPPEEPASLTLKTPDLLTLLDSYTLTTTVEPTSLQVSNYKIEINRPDESTWYTLYNGPNKNFSNYAKVAGYFKLRTIVTINNKDYVSSESWVEMQFPDYYDVIGNPLAQTTMASVWTSIKNDASISQRREKGFWIRVNTQANKYEFTSTVSGDWTPDGKVADIRLGPLPPDSNLTPTPVDTLTYSIASFHGHTPTTYTSKARSVGSSSIDEVADFWIDIPGVIYDYVNTPLGSGIIPAGHALDSRARTFLGDTDITRRRTTL